jgi:hypothetical protein
VLVSSRTRSWSHHILFVVDTTGCDRIYDAFEELRVRIDTFWCQLAVECRVRGCAPDVQRARLGLWSHNMCQLQGLTSLRQVPQE